MQKEIEQQQTKSITIVDTTIQIIEYKGQRVITLSMMDELHHRPDGTAKRNFIKHKKRLEDGKHFYLIDFAQKNEFRPFGIEIPPRGLIIITERGYSMLVKSFTDNFAWEVQDQLVDSYFDNKKSLSTAEFLVEQAHLILEHERKIKEIERRQDTSDLHLTKTRQELQVTSKKADDAFAAASAALFHAKGEPNHYTIIGFCAKHKLKLSLKESQTQGSRASRLSRKKDIKIVQVPDARYGKVNSYHFSILNEVFINMLPKTT